jgi:N-acetylglucosaminyl-diphospho-decaprenol L-rhamnosyltransferase
MTDLTIGIVAHGNRDLLLENLAALAGAARPARSHRTLVLDNASEDGTVEAVRAAHPEVEVIAQSFRDGFGANHNRLLARGEAPYHLVLNDDAVAEPGAIDRLADHLDAHPEAAVVAPVVRYPDGRHQPSAYRFPDPGTALRGLATLGQAGVEERVGTTPRTVDWASGCALLLRRSALDETGPFDEGFFMFSEETDLQRRLRDRGHETHLLPAAVVRHHLGAATAGDRSRRIVEVWRSRRRYWAKHNPGWEGTAARRLGGMQYAALAGLAELQRLPLPHTDRLASLPASELRLHVANALRGPTGPGLREAAEEWNRRHGVR